MGNNLPINRNEVREFKVYNVDAKLFKHSKGKIMITDDSMILIQENCRPTTWPLDGIRKYGCYQDIFLFECGRKCATGEGLFAFKCSKAQMLHDYLHNALTLKSNIVNILPAIRRPENNGAEASRLDPSLVYNNENINNLASNHSTNTTSDYINDIMISQNQNTQPAMVIKLPTKSSENTEFDQIRNMCLNYVTIDRPSSGDEPDDEDATETVKPKEFNKARQNAANGEDYSEINVTKTKAVRNTQNCNQNIRDDYLTMSSLQ